MSRVIFFTSSPERKRRFILKTYLQNNGGKFIAEKRAANIEAENHLNQMLNTYEDLIKQSGFIKYITPVKPRKSQQGLTFPYIKGVNAERKLLEMLLDGKENEAAEIIDTLLSAINSLRSIEANPTDVDSYKQVFGPSFNTKQVCTALGVIDFNLDNIIVDDLGNFHLIDYEWAFDFPVPKQFMVSRFFYYFFYDRYSDVFRAHSGRLKITQVNEGMFVPTSIFDKYEDHFKFMEEVQRAEWSFQSYANQKKPAELTELKTSAPPTQAIPESMGLNKIVGDLDKLRAELREKEQRAIDAETKLSQITESRSYRLSKKISAVRNVVPRNR